MDQRFEGRSVIITGAASGFGKAMAERFAAEGARLTLADLDESAGAAVAADTGGQFIRTDVSQSEDIQAMIARAVDSYGSVDVLINNAGFSHRSMLMWELPDEDYDRVFAVNTKGVFLGCKHVIPVMRDRGGVIINTASIGAIAPRPGVTAYNATKGAVVTLTRGLAVEVARFKIRVNALMPVAADTGFMKGALGVTEGLSEAQAQPIISGIPLRRLTDPSDVAGSAAFLASDDAEFLTGVCLNIDGGRSIS